MLPYRCFIAICFSAECHCYYGPAAIFPTSLVLIHLFRKNFKRSVTSIPHFDSRRSPLFRNENGQFNSQLHWPPLYHLRYKDTCRTASGFATLTTSPCLHGFVNL